MYDKVNTLRFCLAHTLRTVYKLSPADLPGLFQTDSLRYWHSTGKTAEEILRITAGEPPKAAA